MGTTDTLVLLGNAQEGDEHARNLLLEQLRTRLVLWCATRMSRSLHEKMDPEDLAQDALLHVSRGLSTFEGTAKGPFYRWVFRIAENRLRDWVDYFGAQKRQRPELNFLNPTYTQTSPSALAARREEVARMLDAVGRLPEDHQIVIRLRRIEERDYEEIAEIMGRSKNAVRVLYCRAIKALAELLRGDEPPDVARMP